ARASLPSTVAGSGGVAAPFWPVGCPVLGWRRGFGCGRSVMKSRSGRSKPPTRMRRRRGSCIEVVHQFIQQAGDEAHGPDRVAIGHPGRPKYADHAHGAAGLAVRREHEGNLAHLDRPVLLADEDVDATLTGPDAADQVREVCPVLECREDAPNLL